MVRYQIIKTQGTPLLQQIRLSGESGGVNVDSQGFLGGAAGAGESGTTSPKMIVDWPLKSL